MNEPNHWGYLMPWDEGAVHGSCVIGKNVHLGKDSVVWQYTTLMPGCEIGARCSIGANSEIGRGTVIGDDSRISRGVFIPANARLGKRVFIGPNVTMTDDKYPRANNSAYNADPPIIEDDVAVGAGAILLPGVHLEQGCLIGAGAVVTGRVPAGVTVWGTPAETHENHVRNKRLMAMLHRAIKALGEYPDD